MKVYALRQEASLREIGEALGLSFERVRQIEHEALRKLQAVGYPGTAQAASSSLPLGPVAPPTRPTLRSAARYTGDGADSIWTDTGDNPYSLDVAGTGYGARIVSGDDSNRLDVELSREDDRDRPVRSRARRVGEVHPDRARVATGPHVVRVHASQQLACASRCESASPRCVPGCSPPRCSM